MAGAYSFIEVGFKLLEEKNVDKAKAYFNEALKILPSSAEAMAGLASVFSTEGKLLESLNLCKQALKIEPNNLVVIHIASQILSEKNIPFEHETIFTDLSQYLENNIQKDENFHDRTTLLNYCILKFKLEKYLEIGCHDNQNFKQIRCDYKIGIDPVKGGTMCLTSDRYFELTNDNFDIIFIDGLHHCEQSDKDIENAVRILKPNGFIFIHDCMPREEIHQSRKPLDYIWNGDVWKAFVAQKQNPELDSIVAGFDHGIGVIRKRKNPALITLDKNFLDLTWADYKKNFDTWINPMLSSEIKNWLEG